MHISSRAAVFVCSALCSSLGGCAAPGSTFTFYEENDLFGIGQNSDEHYTQGARASWVFPTESAPDLTRRIAESTGVLNSTTKALGFAIGQNMYTPRNISARRLIESDRPYAGWLYAGILVGNVDRVDEEPTKDRLDTFELDLGMVGPRSYAEDTQIKVHKLVNSDRPHGWDNQLEDEPGVIVRYELRRRFLAGEIADRMGWDALYTVGGSLGNVLTQIDGGMQLRFGWNVPRDFGVSTIRRTSMEVGKRDLGGGFAAYLFGAADGMAVGRNIFLDGNSFESSHSVDKEYLVGELRAGLAIEWGNFKVAFTQVSRSKEYREQDDAQRYGSLSLQYVWDF